MSKHAVNYRRRIGVAAGSDGGIYVSNRGTAPATGMGPRLCAAGGQVVRIG